MRTYPILRYALYPNRAVLNINHAEIFSETLPRYIIYTLLFESYKPDDKVFSPLELLKHKLSY